MIERNGGLMDDLISRKAVFELLDDIDSIYLEDYDDTFKSYTDLVNALFDEDRLPSAQPETCDTCKHGYFGDTQCDNCCVRYPSHYERRTDG